MTESFDRSKPLYRAFKMEDGSRQWWSVEVDNMPGRQIIELSDVLDYIVDKAPWREGFETAFAKHSKATVYAERVDPYVVPDDCVALLRHARVRESPYGGRIATGLCFGDRQGRFRDGTLIWTSLIKSGPDENGIIVTRNNRYKLELLETNRGQA